MNRGKTGNLAGHLRSPFQEESDLTIKSPILPDIRASAFDEVHNELSKAQKISFSMQRISVTHAMR
jgi:hypothetical protein